MHLRNVKPYSSFGDIPTGVEMLEPSLHAKNLITHRLTGSGCLPNSAALYYVSASIFKFVGCKPDKKMSLKAHGANESMFLISSYHSAKQLIFVFPEHFM
ncbi:MAG TPA: hypothetical protein DCL66_11920 [Gammaproteobacteria bacterium]|nr:hypothetical protein [Gammaproteobacteria bacterium]